LTLTVTDKDEIDKDKITFAEPEVKEYKIGWGVEYFSLLF